MEIDWYDVLLLYRHDQSYPDSRGLYAGIGVRDGQGLRSAKGLRKRELPRRHPNMFRVDRQETTSWLWSLSEKIDVQKAIRWRIDSDSQPILLIIQWDRRLVDRNVIWSFCLRTPVNWPSVPSHR